MQVLHPGGTTVREESPLSPAHLGYVPALDGLRAVAVGAVVLFHAGFAIAGGGFLGVSVFFTLSGFLITSVVLQEWTGSGAIRLGTFWSRRFRRLLAASWLTMGVVLAMGAAGIWDDDQMRSLRGDVPWSLAELANWHFIAKGTSYGASQTASSPLEHFWSLAIEQQFYVLAPLLLVAMLVYGRGSSRVRLRRTMWVLAGLGVASAVANGLHARSSIDRAYFGTDTRAAELIAGVLLAGILLRNLRFHGADRRIALAAGAAGTVTLVVLFSSAELTSPWLYPWGLLLTAACTASIIVASLQRGPFASVLSLRPVVAVGRISYGIYLLHWPIFLWLTPERTGLDQPGFQAVALFAVRMAVTSVAAIAMFRWVEQPVRSRRVLTGTNVRFVVPAAAVLLLVGDAAITSSTPEVAAYLKPRPPGAVAIREAPDPAPSTEVPDTTPTTIPAAAEPT
ncbi:MAG TPA: acyltransferase, partial [Microthrixaceae bacterium]|nr:acyltransferase [Microthrixaceae bacterium]